jgi:hypothetical protein
MARARKPTQADVEICMKLYDLRRESEMRKARDFINFQFHPQSSEDVLNLMQSLGTPQNAWMRQVFSYWENAASLIVNGAVHPGLFLSWNGEMIFVFAKFEPYLKEMRKLMDYPEFLGAMEKAINGSPEMKKRLVRVRKMQAQMAAAHAAKSS